MLCMVVGGFDRVRLSMGKLSLDHIGWPALFVQAGGGHRPEAVAGHLLSRVAEASQGRIDSIFTHRPRFTPDARENIPSVAGKRVKLLKDFHGLT